MGKLFLRMKVVLICHDSDPLSRTGMARWLSSFAELAGIVELRETGKSLIKRSQAEIRRNGWFRFLDVLLFRFYYKLFLAGKDREWESKTLDAMCAKFSPLPEDVPVITGQTPNSPEVAKFIESIRADMVIARCKVILQQNIFSLPAKGTFVMHPGICPEYRNAHGCFWAVANGDMDKVGMTLLRIDQGVDTGPVYGYYTVDFDPRKESHIVLQHRVVFENLEPLGEKLKEINEGRATPLDTSGRTSAVWGQPWMSRYWRYRRSKSVK